MCRCQERLPRVWKSSRSWCCLVWSGRSWQSDSEKIHFVWQEIFPYIEHQYVWSLFFLKLECECAREDLSAYLEWKKTLRPGRSAKRMSGSWNNKHIDAGIFALFLHSYSTWYKYSKFLTMERREQFGKYFIYWEDIISAWGIRCSH